MPARIAGTKRPAGWQSNTDPAKRFPLKSVAASAQSQDALKIRHRKMGPKAKPLNERLYAQREDWDPQAKRIERSYTREKKLQILSYWFYAGVPNETRSGEVRHITRKKVSTCYLIPERTISNWKQELGNIIQMPKQARGSSWVDPICAYPELEERLFERFWECRKRGRLVRRGWFRLAARVFFGQVYPDLSRDQFRFFNGWFLGFLSRWGISTRITTNKAQGIPTDYKDRIENWLKFNRRNSQIRPAGANSRTGHPSIADTLQDVGRYRLGGICNMDQTPIPFEYLSGCTYAMKGDKTIWAKATQSCWDKRQATLMLTAFADGVPRIPPIIIYHGTENLKLQQSYYGEERQHYDPRVVVWFNKKAYANQEIMLKYFVSFLIPALNAHSNAPIQGPYTISGKPPAALPVPPCPSLIALDAAKFHRTQPVLQYLRAWDIIPSLIPAGCTGLIQPLDVSINGPFKNMLRDIMDAEMDNLGQAALDQYDVETESAVGQRRILMTKCVGQAWEWFSHERKSVVVGSFHRLELSLLIDGSQDRDLSDKGLKDYLEIGDWKRILPGTDSDNELPPSTKNKQNSRSKNVPAFMSAADIDLRVANSRQPGTQRSKAEDKDLASFPPSGIQRPEAEEFEMGLEGDWDERVDFVEALSV